MAATIPTQKLPFADDFEPKEYILPNGDKAILTPREYFDIILFDHQEKANVLSAAKELEAEARVRVHQMLYPNSWSEVGTDRFELGHGWSMTVKRTINVKIDEAAFPAIKKAIEELPVDPDTGEVPSVSGVIKTKLDFSMSGYTKMDPVVRKMLDECLTQTPGSPGIEVSAPKAKAATRPDGQKAIAK